MLKIGHRTEPKKLDLPGGAWLTYRPATTVDHEAGQAAARRFFANLREAKASLAEYGLAGGLDLEGDVTLTAGVSATVSLTEIAMRCVSAWGNVCNSGGGELALDRLNMSLLLSDPYLFATVRDALLAPLHETAEEGNASAPSPSGEPAVA